MKRVNIMLSPCRIPALISLPPTGSGTVGQETSIVLVDFSLHTLHHAFKNPFETSPIPQQNLLRLAMAHADLKYAVLPAYFHHR